MSDNNSTQDLIQELRHLADSCIEGTEYTYQHCLAGRAADALEGYEQKERMRMMEKPPRYKHFYLADFRPPMVLMGNMSTTKLPRYKIIIDCKIESLSNGDYQIKKGFVTDGASVPLVARLLFPPVNKYFGAVVIHDAYCKKANQTGEYSWRHKADQEFYSNLIECGTNKIRAKLMSKAVIAYGKFLKIKGDLK